jgi:hypothetical protein
VHLDAWLASALSYIFHYDKNKNWGKFHRLEKKSMKIK